MIATLQLGFLLVHLAAVQLGLLHIVGPVPVDLGVHNGTLAPCPSPAHCARVDWNVDDAAAALQRLTVILASMPRTKVVEQNNGYLHAEASSSLFGFVDDLELYADSANDVLQARSISRVGDSDLGVNGRRLARLEAALKG